MPRKKPLSTLSIILIGLLLLAFVFLFSRTVHVFLLVFAGILLAIFLRSIIRPLKKYTPLSSIGALALVIVLVVSLLALGVYFIIPGVTEQVQLINNIFAPTLANFQKNLRQFPIGNLIYLQLRSGLNNPQAVSQATEFFSGTFGMLIDSFIILVIGIYLTINPRMYLNGIVKLIPVKSRERAREILSDIGSNLRAWVFGRALVMFIDGLFVTIGLFILGVPLAVPLGFIAGILSFIPNLGPILSLIPAFLVAFAQEPKLALYVTALYILIQFVENYMLTPLVDRYIVALPPVLTLSVQLIAGVLFGFLGLLLSTPLTIVATILVRKLYIEDILKDTSG